MEDSGEWQRPAECEGWMKKQGADAFKAYKKRWFRLVGKNLYYFKTEKGKPQGMIDLTATKLIEDLGRKNAFCLTGPYLARTYFFTVDSAEDKQRWWQGLNNAIKRTVQPEPLRRNTTTSSSGIFTSMHQDLPGDSLCVLDNGSLENRGKIGLCDFELLTVIGRGSFGKVMKARMKRTGEVYAMKVLKKDVVIKENMVEHTKAEKQILQSISHPFIVALRYAFQTKDRLFLVLDFLPGGELFFHLQQQQRFRPLQAKQYAAEIVLALEHLHKHDVIYRDLKPENCVLDAQGFVVLTDFGLAKTCVAQQPTYTFCGTPEYLAPEILKGQGHTKSVDFWSLGVLLYEMLFGLPPFYSDNTNEMYEFILRKPLEFPADSPVEPETRSILEGLLDRDEAKRLKEATTIKAHPYFSEIDFDRLYRKEIVPDFVPDLSASDTQNFDPEFTKEKAMVSICHNPHPASLGTTPGSVEGKFVGFTFTGRSVDHFAVMVRQHHVTNGGGSGGVGQQVASAPGSSVQEATGGRAGYRHSITEAMSQSPPTGISFAEDCEL